ncbi:GH39 family glycosyl hydrolase [Epilithonimonas sp.]|uniref:GH39 family glycosyl hydrolase n=1 Tax=Epilithonimonas sp. TaxID=2894511 RepID=UPI002FDD6DA5
MYKISRNMCRRIIFSSVIMVLLLLLVSNFLFSQRKIEIDFSKKASNIKSVVGFLHFNDLKPLENDIVQLKPRYWRIGSSMADKTKRIEQLKILKQYNITPILVVTDFFFHRSSMWKKPYSDKQNLLNLVEELYKENGNNVVYDLWNEPDLTVFFEGSQQNFFETFKLMHDKIRSLPGGKKATIMGPSISWFTDEYFKKFLDFCSANNITLDLLDWHQNYNIDDALNMKKNIYHAREYYIKKYPNLKIKDIIIPEFVGPEDYFKPLTSLAYINILDKEKVVGCKTCGDAPQGQQTENTCWNNSIDGLLTPQGKPRSVWWVYKYYAESLNTRFNTNVDSERTVAIAYYSQPNKSVNLLLGNLSSSTNTFTIDLKSFQDSSFFSKAKKINYSLYKIPNTEQKELLNPILIKNKTISLSTAKNLLFQVEDIDNESVYLLKMTN